MKRFSVGKPERFFSIMSIWTFSLLLSCQEPVSKSVTEAQMEELEGEDLRGNPWVLDIEAATINNPHYRAVQWTGENMQMVLMSVEPGEEIDQLYTIYAPAEHPKGTIHQTYEQAREAHEEHEEEN